MQKTNTRQLFIIIILGFSLTKLNVLPAYLSGVVGEGILFCSLLNFLLDFLLLTIVVKLLYKYENLTFFEILRSNFGNAFGKFIAFLYALLFLLKSLILIIEQKNSIELTFYETQPNFLTFLPFFIIAFYIILKGVNAYSRSVEVCLYLSIVGFLSILLLSIGAGNYTYLLPLFSQPIPLVLKGVFKSFIWFGDPLYLLTFSGSLVKSKNFKKLIYLAFAISVLITLTIFVIFYAVFDSIAPRQYFAILKMSKYSISLSNIGRFDYLASFLLSLINVYIVVLPLLFCSNLLKEILNVKNVYFTPFITVAVVLCFSLIFQHDFLKTIAFAQNFLVWLLIPLTYLVPIFLLIKSRRKRNGV